MKRRIIILVTLVVLGLLLVGCASNGDSDDVIEIGERFFVTQFEDIVLNANRYLGRTIRYEGAFQSFFWEPTGEQLYFALRFTQGCCSDEPIGFELYLDDIEPVADNTWVEITGVLEEYGEGFLRLQVISLTEPAERGAERVF